MAKNSIDALIDDFNPGDHAASRGPKSGTTITVWVGNDLKARYDRVQELSGRRFSGHVRRVVEAVIEHAEKKLT